MAMIKHPYELSVWKEKLNGSDSKIEEKGVIIGAHDMTYLGKATNLILTRKFNGTNTLTFSMPTMYFSPEKGDYIYNELIDAISAESKIKFHYKDRWYEFFVKKTDEKKNLKSYMITYTCSDAFIDELSRNGYGITFDTELYNNVEEIGDFAQTTLEDSLWQYHPENNWGDFTEYKEEKLYRIPISQFKDGKINGYKLDFSLTEEQLNNIGNAEITNVFTKETRDIELGDDIARKQFWDQKYQNNIINLLTKNYIESIDNDGYIYVPYSCLSFCYGSDKSPDDYQNEPISYDRAATEVALEDNNNLVIAPQSVDPRTIIQFYAFPKDAILEIDDAGVILNKEYSYFLMLPEWNTLIAANKWYIFEDIRLVEAQVLGSYDENNPYISHTFRYLKQSDDNQEALGNKYVIYDGYLSDMNNIEIIKGKKFSITDRSEINISKEIDQYAIVYNSNANDFKDEYISSDWQFDETTDNYYRVCSKIDTRQIIPQLARNFIQNGIDIRSTDGWAPMEYSLDAENTYSASITTRGIINDEDAESISTTALQFVPVITKVAKKITIGVIPNTDFFALTFNANINKAGFELNETKGKIFWYRDWDKNFYNTGGYNLYEGIVDRDISNIKPNELAGYGDVKYLYNIIILMDALAYNKDKIIQFDNYTIKTKEYNQTLWLKNGIYYLRIVKQINDYSELPTNFDDYKEWVISANAKQTEDIIEDWERYSLLTMNEKKNHLNNLARPIYKFLYSVGDWVYNGLKNFFTYTPQEENQIELSDEDGDIFYIIESGNWEEINDANHLILIQTNYAYGEGESAYIRYFYKIGQPTISKNIYQTKIKQGQEIINFGIIGQQQTIKKDKIYCLGISGSGVIEDQPIEIKIGKGTLISDGQYSLIDNDDNKILSFKQFKLNQINFDDNKNDNIYIKDIPPTQFILFKSEYDIDNPYFVVRTNEKALFFKFYLFEAYTKGRDCFPQGEYTYKYSGRDLFWDKNNAQNGDNYTYLPLSNQTYEENEIRKKIIFEDDIMFGTTYEYNRYYIQRLAATSIVDGQSITEYYDTMGKSSYLSSDENDFTTEELPLDAAKYTEDNYEIQTNYIDLNKCIYYNHNTTIDEPDCKYNNGNHICFYQKFGYCPYRFQTEKHPRRVRTLSVSKSNRFNIIQELSKVFEVYPQFFIEHRDNGKVIQDDKGYVKKVFFITEKGKENKIGFRYEKNLKDISRNIASDQIVTKLYVLDVDSELSKTGLCSIKTAEDNPSKDSYIIDLSYYIAKGMLDKDEVEQDLYGVIPNNDDLVNNKKLIPSGFLSQLGYYNTQYDKLTNNIINLQDASFTELEANVTVNFEGIVTAQEQILKIKNQLNKYKNIYSKDIDAQDRYKDQATYKNYLAKLSEQQSILTQLVYQTFFTNDKCNLESSVWNKKCFKHTQGQSPWPPIISDSTVTAIEFFDQIIDFDECKKYWLDQHLYTNYGILGQYNREYQQIQQWKLERASYLKLINQISNAFYLKYEPYLKEGTWSDSNYLTDNAYYFGALDVAAEGAIPKVSYNINVIDISTQGEGYDEIYDFDLCDTTYVEDIGMFGINKKTGMPNRLKTLISEISEYPDDESKNNFKVQNFTTQFDDLFQQVTATVQSLTFNENIYKRSSNFTSLQNISNDSLQGALDTNELVLLNTDEQNIQVDNTGTRGSDINNHANKYILNGQGLFFSNDGGQHWSVGVGPNGINADYIRVGELDAGKIRIADKDYIYFAWDKNGITAYRDLEGINTSSNNVNDAAIFNKYGLTIMKDSKVKLRAGYEYYSSNKNGIKGNINNETEQGDKVGFFLFNNNGDVIFQTTEAGEGARIELTGEIYVKNYVTSSSPGSGTYIYSDGYEKNNIIAYYAGAVINFEDISQTSVIANLFNAAINDQWTDSDGTQYTIINKAIENEKTYAYDGNNLYAHQGQNLYMVKIYKYTLENNSVTSEKYLAQYYTNQFNNNEQIISNYISNIDYSTSQIIDYAYSKHSGTFNEHQIVDTEIIDNCYILNNYSSLNNGILVYNLTSLNSAQPLFHDLNTNIYWGKQNYNSGGGGQEGDVGLFLNNTTIGSGVIKDNERLFVACKKYNNDIRNIFSILKGGQLYIGGVIQNTNGVSISELENEIVINGAGIIIDPKNGGELLMNLDNIKNQDGTMSLMSYIRQMIQNSNDYTNSLYGNTSINIQSLWDQINWIKANYNGHTHDPGTGQATPQM